MRNASIISLSLVYFPEMEATDGAKALFKLRFITRQFLCLSLKKVPLSRFV
jgi:hypothetical protein